MVHISLFSSKFDILVIPIWLRFFFHPLCLDRSMLVKNSHKMLDKCFKILIRVYRRDDDKVYRRDNDKFTGEIMIRTRLYLMEKIRTHLIYDGLHGS